MNGPSGFSLCGPPRAGGTFVRLSLLYVISVLPLSLVETFLECTPVEAIEPLGFDLI